MKKSPQNRQGIALVLVLGFLVLITGLIIAFFINVTNDATSTRVSDGGSQSRQLTDTAVNAVMGQIRQATTGGNSVAWASQPGMVRTYSDNGSPLAYYKLYSAPNMTISGAADLAGFDPAADAITLPSGKTNALYTDLNAPAKDASNNKQYPIFDPAAAGGNIKGFTLPPSTPTESEKAMPTRWQYVLKDGTVTVPSDAATADGKTANWTDGTTYRYPTKDNPIVGRIAYWTDDETCKVNINTACGDDSTSTAAGSFWDVPRVNTPFERNSLSSSIPALNEFQRFPGHPATVYLDKVFPGLNRQEYAALTPREKYGGTQGGTNTSPQAITLNASDAKRLYTSLDELVFDPTRAANSATFDQTRAINSGVTKATLERAKFFATATSRAPEVNLFNQPRVSMWPVRDTGNATADAPYQTVFDKQMIRCCTIGGKPYYFRRTDSQNTTTDVSANAPLLTFLQRLTSKNEPGFGGNFANRYTTDTRDQILVEMLDYIRSTNIYDSFIGSSTDDSKRYTHNLLGNTAWSNIPSVGQVAPLKMPVDPTDPTKIKNGFGRFNTISEAGLVFANEAEKGQPQKDTVDPTSGTRYPGPSPTALGANQRTLQCGLLLEPYCVAQGYYVMGYNTYWEVTGLENLQIMTTPPVLPGSPVQPPSYKSPFTAGVHKTYMAVANNMWGDRSYGGPGDCRQLEFYHSAYDFCSGNFNVTSTATGSTPAPTIDFRAVGDVVVKIYVGKDSLTGILVQTINLRFPDNNVLPMPVFNASTVPLKNRLDAASSDNGPAKENGYDPNPIGPGGTPITISAAQAMDLTWLNKYDLQRSLIVKDGDIRQVALQSQIASGSYFGAHADYFSTTELHAHSFLNSDSLPYWTADKFQKLVNVVGDYGGEGTNEPRRPKLSKGVPQVTTGDFDNGVGRSADGPYINKPDEGVIGAPPNGGAGYTNYFRGHTQPDPPGSGYFAPNRQIPSPGMFGSLPTGPWKTLLFRPPSPTNLAGTPPDFLLMDLFWMPIVQPYAISEPFSTAGKINMNYQIVPFTNIKRTTAFEAALAGEKFLAVPDGRIGDYKTGSGSTDMRNPINVVNMLAQMDKRFGPSASTRYDLFRSASEICSLDLEDTSPSSGFSWSNYQLTGDNSRERPYTVLYQKLTTKSNTYTVHYRVQALKQSGAGRSTATDWATWTESKDQVLSENRGSSTIERYVDPNDPTLPNFLTSTTASLDDYYRFRVISTKKFSP